MNYIYDILLNFNNNIYEFYDWNRNDRIKHIRKIPLFKVNRNAIYEIKNNIVEFDQEFINKINDKTEEFASKKVKKFGTACILTDGNDVIALKIAKDILYSKLLIDEEIDVLEISKQLTIINIDYKVIRKRIVDEYKTRREIEISSYVKRELNKIIKGNNTSELKYLYYECFDEKNESIDEIIKCLSEKIENTEILKKIYEFIKLKNV